MGIREDIIDILKKELKADRIILEIPPNPQLGDYAFPCFGLKRNPKEIANELSKKIKIKGLIKEIKAVGPYLNFYIDKQKIAEKLIKDIINKKEKFGKGATKKERIMVEYVSPNTNKSLHLGHVRNGCLGQSVSKILEFNGYGVVRTSLNNDRGTGVAEAMLGYELYHKGEEPKKIKPDHFVAKCYVDYKMSETDETKQRVQDIVKRWEEGDKETLKLWKKMTEWVYQGYKETYKRLGIKFDKEYYESQIYDKGKEIVFRGLKRGIFVKEDGAIIAPLEKYGLPKKVLIKSDGTSVYVTQDIYLAKLKDEEYDIDRSVYVVASEQENHFRQLFKILELLEFKFAKKCYHLSYGLVNLSSGRMKSREGTVVDADDVLNEVVESAKKEVEKRYPGLNKKEVEKRADKIGLAALKFFMFRFDNSTSFVYETDRSLSFDGETGPYCQYSYARICSILKKSKKRLNGKFNPNVLNSESEEKIIMLLNRFEEVIANSGENYKPNLIARYILDLCQGFNEFYHSSPILKSDDEVMMARLNLILAISYVIKISLNLLDIEVLESM